ncbi:MAG: prepilin-type N-terminal cleavage/methylation domain-containing protein [Geminicoccaceae bacterium]|nr:prepilin-type N-terminal cleavage/methylation domain-containing protein [Geminicoccaceae bacterium]
MAEPAPESGFSLVEALVALTVLGIVLGGALAAGGGSLGVADSGRRELAMTLLAESLLERAGLDLLVDAPVAEGDADGLRWRLERTPFFEAEGPVLRPGERGVRLWRIEARVEDDRGGAVRLATLELAAQR